jgi:enhancing lycopene biosynthesis protein 2
VSFAPRTLCVASQRVFVVVVVVDFVMDSVRKLLDTPSYMAATSGLNITNV